MKRSLLILALFASLMAANAQVYNPSVAGVPINKAVAPAQASSTDSRTLFYDATNFVYRPYVSTAEVLTYLSLAKYRTGQFDIVVNTGGSLSNGVITGGTNAIWYFKDGTADGDLTLKGSSASLTNLGAGFKVGVAGTTNMKTLFNGYGITWDSTSNANGLTAKSDTATLFTAVRSTLAQLVLNVKDFGALGDGSHDDAANIQAAFDYIGANPTRTYIVFFPPGNYKVLSAITLPGHINTSAESIRILIEGYGARIFTTAAIAIFERMPTSQSQALNSYVGNWIPHFRGLVFEGNASTGQVGIRIGATLNMAVEDCNFSSLDTGVVSLFGLQSSFRNLRFTANKTENLYIGFGERWGGTDANSASNSNSFREIRVFGASGAYAHFHAEAANGIVMDNFISEGSKPYYNFVLDSRASTTVTMADLRDIHVEANGGSYAANTVFRIRAGGTYTIKNVYTQYPDTLFNTTGSASSSTIIFDGLPYTGALPAGVAFNANGVQTLGYNLIFRNITDGPGFNTKLFNTASWNGGVIPIELFYTYEKQSGSGAQVIAPGGALYVQPGGSLASKQFFVTGHIYGTTDNTYEWGAITGAGTNYRPVRITVGTGGVVVDNAARLWYGSAAVTSDLSLARGAAGRLDILDNSSAYRDLKLRTLTLTDQINALYMTPSATTADSAVVVDRSTGNLVMCPLPAYLTVANPTATGLLKVTGTTEQLRLLYDGSNYFSTTVGSTGNATFDLAGTSPTFVYNKSLGIGTVPAAKLHTFGTTEQFRAGYDASNYMSLTVGSSGAATFALTGGVFTFSNAVVATAFRTASNPPSANLSVPQSATGTFDTQAQLLLGSVATTQAFRVSERGSTSYTLGVGYGYMSHILGEQVVAEAGSGTHDLLGQLGVKALSVTAGAGAVTNAATVYIEGASNATVAGHNDALWVAAGTARFDGGIVLPNTVSSAGTLTLSTGGWYSFSGTTATYTLPTVASSVGVTYYIKNRGSGTVTINTAAAGTDIYNTSAVNTYALTAGSSIILHNDSVYFTVN